MFVRVKPAASAGEFTSQKFLILALVSGLIQPCAETAREMTYPRQPVVRFHPAPTPSLGLAAWLVLALVLATNAGAAPTQTLRGHVPAAMARLQPIERLDATKFLDLAIGLPLRKRDELTTLLAQLYDPTSPNYHQYLSPAQFAERFGPSEKDYQALIAFAETNGLEVAATHPNRTLLDVKASITDIEKTFHVKMHRYRHPTESRTFYAPDAEPSLELAVPVLSISGLDDFNLPRPMDLRTLVPQSSNFKHQTSNPAATPAGMPALPVARPSHQTLEVTPWSTAYGTGSGPNGTFLGKDFRAAYAPDVSLTGAGEAVGLFELDGYFLSDILEYERLAELPNLPLTNVLLNGFDGT